MLNFVSSAAFFLAVISTGLGLEIQATPTTFEIGITRTLTVKCLAPKETNTSMESLISLVVSRSNGSQNAVFKELASINGLHADGQVIQNGNDNETSEGKINNNGPSHLTLVWEFPDGNKAGVYMCQAHGVDFSGHPVSKNSLPFAVQATPPAVETVVNKVQTLTTQIEQMKVLINDFVNQVKNLTNQAGRTDVLLNRLERMKSVMFSSHTSYNGHRYYLSYPHKTIVAHDVAAVCEMFGGHLVEIDSTSEFIDVHNFLRNQTDMVIALSGVTDEQHEGLWRNRNAGTDVAPYISVSSGGSTGSPNTKNCAFFSREAYDPLLAFACSNEWPNFDVGFICENPY